MWSHIQNVWSQNYHFERSVSLFSGGKSWVSKQQLENMWRAAKPDRTDLWWQFDEIQVQGDGMFG